MSAVLHRNLKQLPVEASLSIRSSICRADDGSYVVDLSSGAGVTCLGHSCEMIKEAMLEQVDLMPYVHSASWTCEAVEQLAALLLKQVGWTDGGAVMFLNSGAEAVEAACKLAVQHHNEIKQQPVAFASRYHSYHGNTFFTLALGDHPRKRAYLSAIPTLMSLPIMRLPAWDGNVDRHLAVLRPLLAQPPGVRWVVVLETIGGTTVGIRPPSPQYLEMIKMECAKAGAVLVFDEVLSGNYRTGFHFAWQYYGVEPDIFCIGKGLTGGYFPLSAVVASPRIMEPLRKGSGKLWHSTTNQNHPIGCAAGLAAMYCYQDMYDQQQVLSHLMQKRIRDRFQYHPLVEEINGVGTLWGIKLKYRCYGDLRAEAMKRGVSIYIENETAGKDQTSILLAPTYDTEPELLERACEQLLQAVEACAKEEVDDVA